MGPSPSPNHGTTYLSAHTMPIKPIHHDILAISENQNTMLSTAEMTRFQEDFQELMMRAKAQIEERAAQTKEDIARVREDIVQVKVQAKENMVYTRERVEVIREEVGIIREGVEIRKAETQKVKHDITLLHALLADISAINPIRPGEDARVSHPPATLQQDPST